MAALAEASAGAAAAAAREGTAALHRKLVWLTVFRVVSVTVLLGGTAVVGWGSEEGLHATGPLYGLVIATYAVSIALALPLRRQRALPLLAYAQVGVDTAIAATVVALTGRADSVFVFMYSLGIVNGAILLYSRGAATALLLALAVHLFLGASGPHPAQWTLLFLQGSAFTVTAALASYLAEQLRRTGERLAASESDLAAITALHEAIVQSVTSGLVTLDLRGRVTFLNRTGEQVLGLSAAEVVGRPVGTWISAFERDQARGETDFTTPRGDRLRLGYSSFPLVGRGDVPFGTALIFQDLTHLRSMEERVARSERLADLGRVSAGLAHELRNPLASMMGSLELLRHGPALGDDDRRLLEIALRESNRLSQLVTQFLEFARPAPPRAVACDLAPVVAETLEVVQNDPAAARVTFERTLGPAPAACDPDQLRQVVWNLVLNAARAAADHHPAPAAGKVAVACGADDRGPFVAVEDDGPGVEPADRDRIFLPFFTTKPDGTGLGLATVHRIVDAHGGTVVVEASPRGGARFVVRLPAAAGAAARAEGR